MRRDDRIIRLWILSILFLVAVPHLLTGCYWNISKSVVTADPIEPAMVKPESIQAEIERLEALLQEETDTTARAGALFRLAGLYAHPANPAPDYPSAFKRLEEYARLDQTGAKSEKVQYQLTLLHEITKNKAANEALKADLEALKKENAELRKESIAALKEENQKLTKERLETLNRDNLELRKKFDALAQENKNMQEVIEKLKHLDIRLEKKRKDIE